MKRKGGKRKSEIKTQFPLIGAGTPKIRKKKGGKGKIKWEKDKE